MTTATQLDVRETVVSPVLLVQVEGSAGNGPGEMARAMAFAFPELMSVVARYDLKVNGPARTTYLSWDANGTRFAVAMPIETPPPVTLVEPGVSFAAVPELSALRFVHHGAYSRISETYERIDEWLRARGAIKTRADWSRYMPMWEVYLNDPATTPESELVTHIYLPLR